MTDATKKPTIKPLDGWTIQTPYGTLKTRSGVHLVRLEDIHTWMCGNGESANVAVYKIFNPFLDAVVDGEVLALAQSLFIMSALTPADALVIGTNRSKIQSVGFFVSAFPDLGHVHFSDGTVGAIFYSMGEGALRVWHGAADITTDHMAVLKDRQDRALDEKYSITWPKDEDLKMLLGRLAVPIELAYELWGWGAIASEGKATGVVSLRSVLQPVEPVESESMAPVEPKNWNELVAFRKNRPNTEWNPSQKGIVAKEANRRKAQPGVSGVAVGMANELGITVTRLNELIRTADENGKRVVLRDCA